MADMKNSVKDRANAQSSCAGWFIQENLLHTGYEGVALHVDMACPATRGERASGYGVSLVTKLLAKI
jgi:probable aminopeptidase NPEPL1